MSRFYDVEIEGWKYVVSLVPAGMPQDHYDSPLGHMIISKDYPPMLKGWHASISPRDPNVPAEQVEMELKKVYEAVGVPCVLLGRKRGIYQSHQDIFRENP